MDTPTDAGLSAADFRGLIGRHRLRVYHLASLVGLHPSRLSLILNERAPLTRALADRLARAIAEETRPA